MAVEIKEDDERVCQAHLEEIMKNILEEALKNFRSASLGDLLEKAAKKDSCTAEIDIYNAAQKGLDATYVLIEELKHIKETLNLAKKGELSRQVNEQIHYVNYILNFLERRPWKEAVDVDLEEKS